MIGHGLWQRRFGGDPSVIGKRILLDGEAFTIVGVMPATFQFAPFWVTRAELWAPLALGDRVTGNRNSNSLRVFARLRDGVTFEQAREELRTLTAHLDGEFPGTNRNVRLVPLKELVVGDIRGALVMLLVAVSFVLLAACANVAHMLLARAATREKEIAVRVALGATRGRIISQLLVESVLLATAGGIVGLSLAFVAIRTLVAMGPAMLPRVATVAIDVRVLAMLVAVTTATAIVFGLVPALRAARVDLAGTFRGSDRGSSGGSGRHRLRNVLVASEFALALMLLAGAGLMIRSFNALRRVDPGFDPHGLLTLSVSVAGTRMADSGARAAFYDNVIQRVNALPGVAGASYINHLPLGGEQWGFSFHPEGRPESKPGEAPGAAYRVVFPDYFRTMRIPLLYGRDFSSVDRLDAPKMAIINEHMARKHWPGERAVGKRFRFSRDTAWVTVVGVSKNTTLSSWALRPKRRCSFRFFNRRDTCPTPRRDMRISRSSYVRRVREIVATLPR